MPICLHDLQSILDPRDPPGIGPERRGSARPLDDLDVALAALPGWDGLAGGTRELIRGLVYLWHDHLDESHQISQGVASADGSLLHGIMHRREPDFGNAKYWFHRVGNHPAFEPLAKNVGGLPATEISDQLKQSLIRRGRWDPFAFVDACEVAERQPPDSPLTAMLVQIQRHELMQWLDQVLRR